jgi:hypothetical protein
MLIFVCIVCEYVCNEVRKFIHSFQPLIFPLFFILIQFGEKTIFKFSLLIQCFPFSLQFFILTSFIHPPHFIPSFLPFPANFSKATEPKGLGTRKASEQKGLGTKKANEQKDHGTKKATELKGHGTKRAMEQKGPGTKKATELKGHGTKRPRN